ncbi:diguanylate cyclase [Bacillus sp. FJAT-27445]|uniref:GGDEF domain-containing protein n=1 Tax=Bacillus sp. FJAT-27445 TaxID=1679166 RepID=UPI0007443AD3|nr:diguanylate cyclase [Bacillus sp. FJAT-27445]
MYKDLISNIAIVISSLAISGQLFKLKPMDANMKTKLLGGLGAGSLGSLLMFFSVKMTDHLILDFRNFAIIISTLYGGWISGLTAAAIIILNRLTFFGVNPSSLTASFVILLLVFISSYIRNRKLSAFTKFLTVNLLNIVLFSIAIILLVKDFDLRYTLILYYSSFSLLGGFIIAWLCDYIVRSNQNFRKLQETASTDFLTGLSNVRQFDVIWNRKVSAAKQTGEPLSLLAIDIDHFKSINDRYGHPDGDKILKQLGEILNASAGNRGIAARNGGEEFSMILPNTSEIFAKEIAEEVRKKVETYPFAISGESRIHITVSIGIATYPDTTTAIDYLLKKADDSLYRAKNEGRNRVCA